MANLISGGVDTFNAMVTGQLHPETEAFLQNDATRSMNSGRLTQAAQDFYQQSYNLYEKLAHSRSAQFVKAAQRAYGHLWQANDIRYLGNVAAMQWAPTTMHSYLMAEPTVRQMYHDQQLEGYEGRYQDLYGQDIGADHYHYRRVMQGVLTFPDNPDENTPEWEATTWFDDLEPEDRELELVEQDEILASWQAMRTLIARRGEDPTSRFNGSL